MLDCGLLFGVLSPKLLPLIDILSKAPMNSDWMGDLVVSLGGVSGVAVEFSWSSFSFVVSLSYSVLFCESLALVVVFENSRVLTSF
eukprot:scaffold115589_cov29-Attheya_sp.AAC.2